MGKGKDAGQTAAKDGAPAKRKSRKKRAMMIAAAVVVVIAVGIVAAVFIGRSFTAQESEVRSDWSVEAGALLSSSDEHGVDIREASMSATLRVAALVPNEIDTEDFTYYDEDVQDRLAATLGEMKAAGAWTAVNPLAVLNPFGTGSNALYLYFTTDFETEVSYTIRVDDPDVQDWTATANNVFLDDADEGDGGLSRVHEFQIVGLVPGKTNEVTLTVTGSAGNVRQQVSFSIDMPETDSGYPTQLESVEGSSDAELSNGLYVLARTNGYLGYGFFFDNGGTMRYEMVTEGFGLDRILEYGDDIVTCVSSRKLARMNGLGKVEQVYDLGDYELHHDINYGGDGVAVALVEKTGRETVEDVVIEIDLVTGEVSELVDFTGLMSDYVEEYTHAIGVTDAFFWQAGERDWIHLNTVEYLEEDDAIIVSSRETSTIIKVEGVHDDPRIAWMAGDDAFWEGTAYEDLCLDQVGDFTPQYGQHSVEYDGAGAGAEDGTYYLLMFDNNYWALSTRSGYAPDLEGTDVVQDLYGNADSESHVYRYLVDENAGTFELVSSFDVPYSSIVSNVAYASGTDNYVVNSGIANVFGEYDSSGNLIRQFSYTCTLQGYRVFKDDFAGFWFAE